MEGPHFVKVFKATSPLAGPSNPRRASKLFLYITYSSEVLKLLIGPPLVARYA
jgi:hypothetical protein